MSSRTVPLSPFTGSPMLQTTTKATIASTNAPSANRSTNRRTEAAGAHTSDALHTTASRMPSANQSAIAGSHRALTASVLARRDDAEVPGQPERVEQHRGRELGRRPVGARAGAA